MASTSSWPRFFRPFEKGERTRAESITATDVGAIFGLDANGVQWSEKVEDKAYEARTGERRPEKPSMATFVKPWGERGEIASALWFFRPDPHSPFKPGRETTIPEQHRARGRGWRHAQIEWLACSPDREVWSWPPEGPEAEQRLLYLIEMKTPIRKRPIRGTLPPGYYLQMQHQMCVCDVPYSYYVCWLPKSKFCPEGPYRSVLRVVRDKDFYNDVVVPILKQVVDNSNIGPGLVPVFDLEFYRDDGPFAAERDRVRDQILEERMKSGINEIYWAQGKEAETGCTLDVS